MMNHEGLKKNAIGPILLGLGLSLSACAQSAPQIISLDPPESGAVVSMAAGKNGLPAPQAPANFREFREVRTGDESTVQKLTLRFAETTHLMTIKSTPDFKVEPESTCGEGNVYSAKATCTLMVRFTPQGPGHRVGHLMITQSTTETPLYVGLGGNSYTPVLTFIPSVMTTVSASLPSGQGLLNGAQNLAVDGGDTLYVSDTGNNVVRLMDSSNQFMTIASNGIVAPVGIGADPFGEVYFTEPTQNLVYEIFEYGSVLQLSGSGTDACNVAAPCSMTSEKVYTPGQLAFDAGNQMFFEDVSRGAAVAVVQPYPATLARLYDPFTYQTTTTGAFSVDQYDNMYTAWEISGLCQINAQTYSDSANSRAVYKKVAGGKFCGFGGDGGPARNAEISNKLGQITFDIAGNMYFTDTNNQRIRRVDYSTGIINTIAGTGSAGFSGDNGPATSGNIRNPSGIAVDSQGQVYFTHNTTTTGTAESIRKIGTTGIISFSSQVKGTSSSARHVTLSNTGNSVLTFTNVLFTGTNASEFKFDPASTSCNVTAGGTLANGQSCKIGVIFTPTASGTRSASLIFNDNTFTNQNTITLTGPATLPAAVVAIAAPSSGTSVKTGTTVKFSVGVTSTSGSAPKGSVKFSVDGAAYGSPVAVSAGTAYTNVTGLKAGTHTLLASYSGDTNYAAAGPLTRSIIVTAAPAKAAATVALATRANPATACSSISFSAAVTANSGLPSGTVDLKEGTKVLTSGTLSRGLVSLNLLSVGGGTHMLTASYKGDKAFAPAVSAPFKEVVTSTGPCSKPQSGKLAGNRTQNLVSAGN